MGGEAAKERRRAKRLQAGKDGVALPPTSSSTSMNLTTDQPADGRENPSDADAARRRLERKFARKANGTFKSHAISERTSRTSNHSPIRRKNNNNSVENDAVESSFRDTDRLLKRKRHPPTTSRRKPAMNDKTKTKNKTKPKHLKRKIEHLSKAIIEGNSISELDKRMKLLQDQMEAYKRQKLSTDEIKEMRNNEDANQSIEGSRFIAMKEAAADNENRLNNAIHDDSGKTSHDGHSSSDDDDIVESVQTRTRGKRRRGRRENTLKESSKETTCLSDMSESNKSLFEDGDSPSEDSPEISAPIIKENSTQPPTNSNKTSRKDDKRRCIGRKPITDYVVGNLYSGKVKYIKPKLGAFIDIGSHSDAFCHISCISDDFVSCASDVLKVDDIVQNARVLEVDREKKRITVSLRREAMKESEFQTLKATRQYEDSKKTYDRSNRKRNTSKNTLMKTDSIETTAECIPKSANRLVGQMSDSSFVAEEDVSNPVKDLTDRCKQNNLRSSDTSGISNKIAGADLKRERKLARRAERRAAMEASCGKASK